jgi:hypothetical protein
LDAATLQGLGEITVVADRGMVSQATLEVFEQSHPPVCYSAELSPIMSSISFNRENLPPPAIPTSLMSY